MDGRFRVYNFIARFIPESERFFGLKPFLLRRCGCRVGKGARISSAVRFSGVGTVDIGGDVSIEEATRIRVWGGSVTLADGVRIGPEVVLEAVGDKSAVTVGERTTISLRTVVSATFGAAVKIGCDNKIAHMVSLKTAKHDIDLDGPCIGGKRSPEDIVIGSGCWICAGVIVTPGKSVGDRCVLGAGAVVTRNVPSGTLAAGVPATVRKRYLGTDEPPTRI